MIPIVIALWLFIAACVFRWYAYAVDVSPECMPGGRRRAMAFTSLIWPVLLAMIAAWFVARFYEAVLDTITSR